MSEDERLWLLLESERFADALVAADRLLASEPNDPSLWHARGRAYLGLERWDDALHSLGRAGSLTPDDPTVHLLAAIALRSAGRGAEALSAALEGMRLDPMAWQGHLRVAETAAFLREHRELAWSAANRAVELAPGISETHSAMGLVAMQARRLDVADEALQRALSLDPQNHVAQHNLGVVKTLRGQFVAATGDLAVSAAADPQARELGHAYQAIMLRWLQRTHWGIFGLYLLTRPFVDLDVGAPWLLGVAVLGLALLAWWTRRTVLSVRSDQRRVLWRMLRRSGPTTGWFACVCLAALAQLLTCLAPAGELRMRASQATIGFLIVGVVLSWLRVFTEDRQRRR